MLDQRHDAQDRAFGTNTRAEEARADAEADALRLWKLSAQIEQAIDLLADIELAAKALAHLIDLPDGRSIVEHVKAVRFALSPLEMAVTDAHRRAEEVQ